VIAVIAEESKDVPLARALLTFAHLLATLNSPMLTLIHLIFVIK
jgi:hypothetical protein